MLTYCAVFLLLIVAYLLGSIPSAVWIGKHYFGVDIREHGSKNAGATNMLRVLGLRAALPVFVIDFLKGFVAVTLMGFVRLNPEFSQAWVINLKIVAVAASVVGHIFPIFAGFRGGKGVSTLIGAVTAVQPNLAFLCFAVWVVVFVFTHYVSLASIVAGCCFPVFVVIFSTTLYNRYGDFSWIFIIFSLSVALMLLWTHRANIGRLRRGEESKIHLWKKKR
ncbi:MAG: glycerol-3-phosphate 1-O-acyltransferase PlsY [Alistipes sp.]|nr:glycerol-3-phosphate 1-O-acyltransferase PlsY [Alistipes sp.]